MFFPFPVATGKGAYKRRQLRQEMISKRYMLFSASSFPSTQGDIKSRNYFFNGSLYRFCDSRPVIINLFELWTPLKTK